MFLIFEGVFVDLSFSTIHALILISTVILTAAAQLIEI